MRTAQVGVRSGETRVKQAESQAASEFEQARSQFETAVRRISLEERNLQVSRLQAEAAQERYKLGASSPLEFRDAQTRLLDYSAEARGIEGYYDKALSMLHSEKLRSAFDLSKESGRDKYGDNKIGQGLCLAKRLIEKTGAKFVEVTIGGWDNHVNIFDAIARNLSPLDQALAALISDLKSTGLLDKTLIVLSTDFGRTPTINVNNGRDHFPKAYSQVLIGAGIKGGMVYGSTDKQGKEVSDGQVSVQDFNCTVAAAIGLPIEEKLTSSEGRPFTIADKGKPITQVLA